METDSDEEKETTRLLSTETDDITTQNDDVITTQNGDIITNEDKEDSSNDDITAPDIESKARKKSTPDEDIDKPVIESEKDKLLEPSQSDNSIQERNSSHSIGEDIPGNLDHSAKEIPTDVQLRENNGNVSDYKNGNLRSSGKVEYNKRTKNLFFSKLGDVEKDNVSSTGEDDDEDEACFHDDGNNGDEECSTDALYDSSESVKSINPKPVGFFKLFRFATCSDVLLMLIGTLGAMVTGTAFQLNFLVYGRVLDLMIDNAVYENSLINGTLPLDPSTNTTAIPAVDQDQLFQEMRASIKWFIIIACSIIVSAFFEMSFWMWSSERQVRRMREATFWAILNKDQGWFDRQQVGGLTTMLVDDIQLIHSGLGDKIAKMLEWLMTFLSGYTLGFVYGWKLTLVILSVLPLLGLATALLTKVTRKLTARETAQYASAGAVAEEVLSAVRTVVAYGGEDREVDRYGSKLASARQAGCQKALYSGLIQGVVWFTIFGAFGVAFWYGTRLVGLREYTGGRVLQIFLGMLQGTIAIGHAVPSLEKIAEARSAAANVFDIIDDDSGINSSCTTGDKPDKFEGHIEFRNVSFSYPTRRVVQILSGLSFSVRAGQTIALVGASGSGKSTVLQLLQRFYEVDQGEILIDGRPLPSLSLPWWRHRVGVVSQEPVLFAATIAENIRLGYPQATQAEIIKAAREANAHHFIMTLPKKYETPIGEQGGQLSGGQKQRVAIARALVGDPKVLLLDEATSALDTQSEASVQKALEKASEGRTTLIVAHRLSTIKNASCILSLKAGRVVEAGTHKELMTRRGLYYRLVNTQSRAAREMSVDSVDGLDGPALAEEILKPVDRSRSVRRLNSTRSFGRMDSMTTGVVRRGSARASGRERESKLFRSMSVMSQQREEEKEAEKLPPPAISRILRMARPDTPKIVAGCVGAVFMGAATPTFSVALSEVLENFATGDEAAMMEKATLLSAMFVVIGVVSGLGVWVQTYFFGAMGENLTMYLRKVTFAAMLKQEMAWFDQPQNQVGSLTGRLAGDASRIKGAAGQQFGILVQAITNMGAAIIIAFYYGPKLAGVLFVFIPLMFISGIVQGKVIQDSAQGSMDDLDQSAQVACEAIGNIQTVAALTRERHFHTMYSKLLRKVFRTSKKSSFVFGIFYSISQSIIYFSYAATFGYGAVLIERGEIQFFNVFRVFACLIFGSMSLGRALSWMPDYSKAKVAASKIFSLLDREPQIQSLSDGGICLSSFRGEVSLMSVRFRYPSRRDVPVLSGLSLSISPGQTVALVGASGCGKSTTIQLLERFYDPDQGCVCLDGQNLISLSLPWIRSQIGLVSQEPTLFDLTIRENIAYGDQSRLVADDDIIAAARQANIHEFISSLPQGYDTNVGEKGTQLSGGQRQRIAIARALLRQPKILLLDEATSALDTESEKVVQRALDSARAGRTCIIIAHRLSTIETADVIVILHNGQVVEAGSHRELMDRRGFYYELQKAQRRGKSMRRV